MRLIDLHCDTASRIYKHKQSLEHNDYHISIDKLKQYAAYTQVMAIFISNRLSDDEGFVRFNNIYNYYMEEIAKHAGSVENITDGKQINEVWGAQKHAFVIGVEDARILNNDITKLQFLHQKGVRLLTLLWSGQTCIGGSHNTQASLTPFGREVTKQCFELGIVPDISHASEQSASDMIEIAQSYSKPLIASHSNSYSVYPHSRNLRDNHFLAIKELGGLVGISLCKYHLGGNECINVNHILKHIDYYLSLGGENTVALGGDLDGTDLPDGFADIRDITKIADNMAKNGYSDELINKLFWENAKIFFENNIH